MEIIAINGNRQNFHFKNHALCYYCSHIHFLNAWLGHGKVKGLDQGDGTKISTVSTIWPVPVAARSKA